MRLALIVLFVIAIATCICSCSKNGKVRDSFFHGMYELGNQVQKRKHADEPIQWDKEQPSYDQYKRERQELISGNENDQSQQQGN